MAGTNIRVRLTLNQAIEYQEMLAARRHTYVRERAAIKDSGGPVTSYNNRIEELDRMAEELARSASERGWPL
jgi:hypothetical protein